jgi:cobalamin synthase
MSLGNAIGYLTAVRVPARRQVPLAYSLHYFPWVGAAVGSLSILAFLVANRFLPNALCCLIAVLFPQFLAGWDPWRGVAERIQGHRNFPGHGFRAGFRLDARGFTALGSLLAVKWVALMTLPLDWQTRAVFIYPILGYCARTAAFLLSPVKGVAKTPLLARRRVRAGFLSGFLVFLVFQFPARVALPMTLLAAGAVWGMVRRQNRLTRGLTLQTASSASELAEVIVLALLAFAAPFAA